MCSLETSIVPPEDAGVLLRTSIAVSLCETFSHTRALVSAFGAQLHTILIAEAEMLAGNAFGRHWFWFLRTVTHLLLHILFETSPVKRCPIWVPSQGADEPNPCLVEVPVIVVRSVDKGFRVVLQCPMSANAMTQCGRSDWCTLRKRSSRI